MASILVVDDSVTDRRLIANALVEHTVVEAASGDEGVEKAQRFKPDLIIMDVVMPGKNGFQACREIRKQPATKDIPIIMLTTKDQPTDKEWALRQGASEYLTKPFTDEALTRLVAQHI